MKRGWLKFLEAEVFFPKVHDQTTCWELLKIPPFIKTVLDKAPFFSLSARALAPTDLISFGVFLPPQRKVLSSKTNSSFRGLCLGSFLLGQAVGASLTRWNQVTIEHSCA